ncbi:MAG: VOC family protein [Pseudomonadales bacterium]
MKLRLPDYIVLIVEDLDLSLTFYTEVLGMQLKHRAEAFAQLETGATRLALFTREAMSTTLGMKLKAPDPDAPGFELGFKVDDVDEAYRELRENGAPEVIAPTTRPWGQRTAYVRDPDGHLIELAQDPD